MPKKSGSLLCVQHYRTYARQRIICKMLLQIKADTVLRP